MKSIKNIFEYILWMFGWKQFISMQEWGRRDKILNYRFLLEAQKNEPSLEYMKIIHDRMNENYKSWRHMNRGGVKT